MVGFCGGVKKEGFRYRFVYGAYPTGYALYTLLACRAFSI